MSDQYVFELQFEGRTDGSDYRENQFVIIDKGSMADFSKLREDLSKCNPEPFRVQYLDDEDDIISIDTEEEFKEFAKLAKQRSSRGMLIRLILNSNLPLDHNNYVQLKSHPSIPSQKDKPNQMKKSPVTLQRNGPEWHTMSTFNGQQEHNILGAEGHTFCKCSQEDMELMMALASMKTDNQSEAARQATELYKTELWNRHITMRQSGIKELQSRIKDAVKREILEEMKDQLAGTSHGSVNFHAPKDEVTYEEDSDGNNGCLPEKKKEKQLNSQKKLERREKVAETRIDQRLEKLELKKKKLLEKASLRTVVNRKPAIDATFMTMPSIMSAIATKASSSLLKRVTAGKVFLHVWHVINDGTVPWGNVELRHTWSSAGLEPDEPSVKCIPLPPGQESQITMKFKAPKTVTSFISYWHFFYQVDSQWQQFGHYVPLIGSTKLPKASVGTNTKVPESIKKVKETIKTVTFNEEKEKAKSSGAEKEGKILNKETIPYMAQLEANLASAEIAAEMAREAANAAFRRAVGIQTSTSREMAQLNKCLDEIVALNLADEKEAVQTINLVDSSSDTDANVDINEETDPGFVFVDIPGSYVTEQSNLPAKGIQVNIGVDSSATVKETSTIHADNIEEKNSTNNCAPMPTEDKKVNDEVNGNKSGENAIPVKDKNEGFDAAKQPESSVHSSNEMPITQEPGYDKIEQTNTEYPRLVPPSIAQNYVFHPSRSTMGVLPPHHQQTTSHSGYPVFPPQNSSSHAIVFPPPPMIHFSTPKMTSQVPYPQIPTYHPIPCSSHPLPPLISSLSAIPPQSAMAPPSQMVPTQMNPTPMAPQPMMGPFPMNSMMPIRVHGYEHFTGQTSSAAPVMNESKSSSLSVTSNPITEALATSGSSVGTNNVEGNSSAGLPLVAHTESTNGQAVNKPEPVDPNKKPETSVQILPQALVDGAINVASTAYSTAWNALSNLRLKDGEATEFDPVFENNMALLVEMGFNNLERNATLLKRFNNDVSQVIGVICATGGADNLNIG